MRLHNRIALITGAGRGIGRAIAEHYAREGARVAVADVDYNTAQEVAEIINRAGGSAMALAMDVTDEQAVNQGVHSVVDAWGGPGHCAGQRRHTTHCAAGSAEL